MPDVAVAGECADAHEVLERVRAGGIDAVLLDIQMPELSGIEALQLFPADGPVVIFCTAHTGARGRGVRPRRDRLPAQADRGGAAAEGAGSRARPRRAPALRRRAGAVQEPQRAREAARSAGAADAPGDRAAGSADGVARRAGRRAGHRSHRRRPVSVGAVAAGAREPPARRALRARAPARAASTWNTSCAWSRTRSAATRRARATDSAVEMSRQAARELRKRLGPASKAIR